MENTALVSTAESYIACRPFLKWAGGKSQLLTELLARVPKSFNCYFEPFLGGGALFFGLQPKKARLSDNNSELINCYSVVRNNLDQLLEDLHKHKYESEYYYTIRKSDRAPDFASLPAIARASRFIYLNKTCYNGLYRVNSKGQFNVPMGRYTAPTIVDEVNLRACSSVLANADVSVAAYDHVETSAEAGDFVYFDPPYLPRNATSNFTSYTEGGFAEAEHERLGDLCRKLNQKGVFFMVSNSHTRAIWEIYKGFNVSVVNANRSINSKAKRRGRIEEYIITNYDL